MSDAARPDAVYPDEPVPRGAVSDALRRTWWLALGLLATIGEKTTHVAETLVEKGRVVEPSVRSRVEHAAADVSGMAGSATTRVKRAAADVRVPPAFRARRPTAEEFDKLAEEVRELRARVGNMPGEATRPE